MGCSCLLALLGTSFPRLALLFTWLFTTRVAVAFHHALLLPLLGLVFLPMTTLMYSLAYAPVVGVHGWGWLFVTLGLLADLGSTAVGGRVGSRSRTVGRSANGPRLRG